MRTISVEATTAGWAVRSDGLENEQLFHSGGRAEQAARRLAEAVANSGEAVEVLIRLRDGTLAARFLRGPQGVSAIGAILAAE